MQNARNTFRELGRRSVAGAARCARACSRPQASRVILGLGATLLVTLSTLHLFTGFADNGDFTRSTSFLLERPASFRVNWPEAGTPDSSRRFFNLWHDSWVVASDGPDISRMESITSYKALLLLQVGFDRLVTGNDGQYSMIVGSLPTRMIFLLVMFALAIKARKRFGFITATLFAALLGLAHLESTVIGQFNSAYEDQIAVLLLPAVALAIWTQGETPSRTGAVAALALAAFMGSAKAQFFYLPLLLAPFLWNALRAHFSLGAAVGVLFLSQTVSCVPVFTSPYKQYNAFHALYGGVLTVYERKELIGLNVLGKPVLAECVGESVYSAKGHDCYLQARASHADSIFLLLTHPLNTYKLIARLLQQGATLEVPLGKRMEGAVTFSETPLFNVWRGLFGHLGAWLAFAAVIVGGAFAVRWRKLGAVRGVAGSSLFLALFAASQYLISLGDGFRDLERHVIPANFSIAMCLCFGGLAIASSFAASARGTESSTAICEFKQACDPEALS